MAKVLLWLLLVIFIFACGNKNENKKVQNISPTLYGTVIHNDSITPPSRIKVTVAPVRIKVGEPELIQNPFGNGLGAPNFTNYGTEDGLPISALNCCISDKMGRIWISSSGGGISCFDGKKFTNYNTANGLSASNCWEILHDRNDNIWVTTWGAGVNIFNGTEFKSLSTKDGLSSNRIFSILEDKEGSIWMGSDDAGINIYKNKKIISYSVKDGLASNKITDITMTKNGQIWIATNGGGASLFDGKTFRNFTIKDGLPSNNINCIASDSSGKIWFGTDGAGLGCLEGETFKIYSTKDGIAENIIRSAMVDNDNHLWFGTEHNGVSYFDGKTFTTYNKSHGLGENSIGYSCVGKNGTIWFATYGGGLSCYKGNAITQLQSSKEGSVNMIFNVTETKSGKIILGKYGNGFSLFDGKTFKNYSSKQGLPNERIYSIIEDKKGDFWLASEGGGLIKFDGKYFTQYTTNQGLVGDKIRILAFDNAGNLWIGTDGSGISRFDGNEFINYTTKQGLASNTVWSLYADKSGKIWIGTMAGLCTFNGKEFTIYTTKDGLCGNAIGHISEDPSGNIWIGSIGSGVSKFDGKKFVNYNTSNGLADDLVYAVVDDVKNGTIWIGTNLGLSGLVMNSQAGEWIYFNNSTGYPLKDFNSNAMMIDSKGIIWGGMGDGKLMRFDYLATKIKKEIIKLTLQEIKINHEQISWHTLFKNQQKTEKDNFKFEPPELNEMVLTFGKVLNKEQIGSMQDRFGKIKFSSIEKFNLIPENLVLPYENNNITFDFGAIAPSQFAQIKYQYMMKGYDKTWSPLSNLTTANFGNMDEGKYTFKLRAYYGPKDFSAIEYSFSVSPPLYRKWWAYLLYILAFLLALRIFSLWREKSLRHEKEKLENMVVERTTVVEKQKEELVLKNIIVEKEKQRSDDLLLNILPEEVAEELKAKGSAEAKQFDQVTVLFTDFEDFTLLSEKMTAKALVEEIHTCFMAFDKIMEKYGIEKIKTIGDSYMCAGGLPVANKTHASDLVDAGIEIQQFILNRVAERTSSGKEPFQIRIGIHTGPVVAGIVGIKKFAYDIWGDTVNTASRMESSGEVGKVNISGTTYELVKHKFKCTHRGKIQAKNKGELDMYFVEGRI